tara:strand:- start:538 stop:723 length:186 start_codon:yes stop_codon:yes gene_type:complete
VKERQVNQLTTPVEIAKAMYLSQQPGVMESIIGQPDRKVNPESAQVKELVRQIMSQSEIRG